MFSLSRIPYANAEAPPLKQSFEPYTEARAKAHSFRYGNIFSRTEKIFL